MEELINFQNLVSSISAIDDHFKKITSKAINKNFTIRNWLIGAYIVIFEQQGKDRAEYGTNIIDQLAKNVNKSGLSSRILRQFRQFYQTYPALMSDQFESGNPNLTIWQMPSAKLYNTDYQLIEIWQTASAKSLKEEKTLESSLQIPSDKLLSNLAYSHFVEIMSISDPLKRIFYELETIKGRWSVSQLKRQINTLYYERSAMSKDPALLSKMVNENNDFTPNPTDILKDVLTLEFLGLPTKLAVTESDLEQAILDNIEHFILELGHGFCFEARQQKILIGDEYFFIDLVFYHRILKCHILIDLKVDTFNYSNAGQINTYLNYYKDKVVRADDNPPIGILLVTDKNKALVEYATAGMDEQLFVRKYLVELPRKEDMIKIIEQEIGVI